MTSLYSLRASTEQEKRPALLSAHTGVLIMAVVCLALVCVSGRDGLGNLYDRWRYEEEYGYGFIIVALVPLLLWRRWREVMSSSGTGWLGLFIVLIAQLCMVVAVLGESYYIEQIAFFVSLLGVGLAAFGSRAFWTLLPLTLLLLLTAPLPYTLQAIFTIKLQLISTDLAVAFIRLLGIPVYVAGNIIDLGTYKLQVAEACSGLRYLLPLTCISFLVAYLYKAPFWKKAVLVISAAPITILINSFRIAVTAVLVDQFGGRMAEGFLHEFEGWIVFLLGVLLLGLEMFALEGFRWSNIEIELIMDRTGLPKSGHQLFRSVVPLLLTVAVCAGTLGLATSITAAHDSTPPPSREDFAVFPQQIGRWTGRSSQLDAQTIESLKATDYYVGDFVETSQQPAVNLFVAYYDSLSKGAAIHSPRVCLPGSGWEFASFKERNFSELEPGVPGTFYDVVAQKSEQKVLMYYWYQQRERRTANEFSMKYYLLVDSFYKSRNDGALVRLSTPIDLEAGDKAEADAATRLHAFARAVIPKLPRYLPE